jgi:hypothetical protein
VSQVSEDALLPVGTVIGASHFKAGQYLDVTGVTKGKGFAGVMKRWNFAGQNATHGNTKHHRCVSVRWTVTCCFVISDIAWRAAEDHAKLDVPADAFALRLSVVIAAAALCFLCFCCCCCCCQGSRVHWRQDRPRQSLEGQKDARSPRLRARHIQKHLGVQGGGAHCNSSMQAILIRTWSSAARKVLDGHVPNCSSVHKPPSKNAYVSCLQLTRGWEGVMPVAS